MFCIVHAHIYTHSKVCLLGFGLMCGQLLPSKGKVGSLGPLMAADLCVLLRPVCGAGPQLLCLTWDEGSVRFFQRTACLPNDISRSVGSWKMLRADL